MVTVTHPGPHLDEITLTFRGRTTTLNKYSDSKLLDRALAELKRVDSKLNEQLSVQHCGLISQAIEKILYYKVGHV